MRLILYQNFYVDKNPERQKELDICLKNNLLAGFDLINIFIEAKDEAYIVDLTSQSSFTSIVRIFTVETRPTFQKYIDHANGYPEDTLHIVANSDIYIEPKELKIIKSIPWNNKLFLGLSRFDTGPEGSFLLDRRDSQDTYVWYSHCNVENLNCPLGFAGVDNHTLYKFKEAGYNVINPSKSIITNHLHNVKINNYRNEGGDVRADQICGEPYFFAAPQFLHEITF